MINSPEIAEELFLTKNKYFDKHDKAARLFQRFMGDTILFAKSDLKWQQKRKSLSAALYKDKLRAMVEMMKKSTIEIIRNKWMKANDGIIDIVKETSNLFINITLCCLFGTDQENIKIIQKKDGKEELMLLGESMIYLSGKTLNREF